MHSARAGADQNGGVGVVPGRRLHLVAGLVPVPGWYRACGQKIAFWYGACLVTAVGWSEKHSAVVVGTLVAWSMSCGLKNLTPMPGFEAQLLYP